MVARLGPREVSSIASEVIDATQPLIDPRLIIPKSEYNSRWETVQRAMKADGYDFAYACGSELDRSDIAWLAGVFDPIIERYGIMMPSEGPPCVLCGSEGGHVIEEAIERSGAGIVMVKEFQISDEDYRHTRFVSLDRMLRDMRFRDTSRLGLLSSPQFIPHQHVVMFQGLFGPERVSFVPELLQRIKYEKSDNELAICQAANVIADAALRTMLAVSVPGMTELEIAGVGDFVMKELGAGRTGFPTIVTSGQRNYTVIGPATNRAIREGDIVSMGVSPTFNGYHGISRRTVRVGMPLTEGQVEFLQALEGLYRVVIEAVEAAAREGLATYHIDRRGKEYLNSLRLRTMQGKLETPIEPYTFIHNTGCSECQEGYGAVTPYTTNPLGRQVALMIDVALLGFKEKNKPLFEILYAVIEDAFWKKGDHIGVFNKMPLNVQSLVGNLEPWDNMINPYHKAFSIN